MRWVVMSVAIHAIALWLLVGHDLAPALPAPSPREPVRVTVEPTPIAVEMFVDSGGSTPARSSRGHAARIGSTRARNVDPWAGLSISTEQAGDGRGNGRGGGNGNGIGFGNGGGVAIARDVPAPPLPAEPPPSKARPAKLIWPTRDLEVEDESALFVAKVTVDADGSVVGARMMTNRPGSRADHAANAIWTFRYMPALDDAGKPIRSTFEQPFQVR